MKALAEMGERLEPGLYRDRNGAVICITGRGFISNNVILGYNVTNNSNIGCWRADGKWRWDNESHDMDLIERT